MRSSVEFLVTTLSCLRLPDHKTPSTDRISAMSFSGELRKSEVMEGWFSINGEAIHGSRPWRKHSEGDSTALAHLARPLDR